MCESSQAADISGSLGAASPGMPNEELDMWRPVSILPVLPARHIFVQVSSPELLLDRHRTTRAPGENGCHDRKKTVGWQFPPAALSSPLHLFR